MNICLASYQSVMMLKGGPRTQILQTANGLKKLGVQISYFETWNEMDRLKIDLIHLFGANIGTYHLAREIHKVGIPMVISPIFYSLHSSKYINAALFGDKYLRKLFQGFWSDYGILSDICTWAKMVFPNTQSESTLLKVGLNVPASKIRLIPNGVDPRFQNCTGELFRNKYGVDNFILNVGHIGPERKNVLRLIRAVKDLDVPTVIIGRIEDNTYGRICLEEARANSRILIIDSLPNDSDLLSSAYAACSCFVLPSLFETPGIAALEAGLAGAKIVITKHGGTTEYFGSHAEYVDPLSIDSIRQGILRALTEEKSVDLQTHIKNEYLWDRIAQKTFKIYDQLLSKK
ncbi:MAG: glycosyltransferase [Ignavibacteriales bacterium]|nr:glycosyltransferase [Ignavibacteriales bacterium]